MTDFEATIAVLAVVVLALTVLGLWQERRARRRDGTGDPTRIGGTALDYIRARHAEARAERLTRQIENEWMTERERS